MRGIRSQLTYANVISTLCLVLILGGGAAYATHPGGANTISTVDIINGQVRGPDIAAAQVNGSKLAPNSVNTNKVADDSLRSEDILDGQIRAIDVAFGTLRGDEILDGTVGGADLADNDVKGDDVDESTLFNDDSLTAADLAVNSVGGAELFSGSVGAEELGDGLVDRSDPQNVLVAGGTAHNGAYNFGTSDVSCNAGEELIGAHGQWFTVSEPIDDAELFIKHVNLNHPAESATVIGGNDSGDSFRLVAVATCLQP